MDRTYVRAMESRPPPAPASAWATLSLCWAAGLVGVDCVDCVISASFCCAVLEASSDMVVVALSRVVVGGGGGG
jgi:hypothetical protein